MSSTGKNFKALVKWVGGAYDKTYTPGIKVEHIKNFDVEKFRNDEEDPDKVYVVEWHDTPKEPLGGWETFNAKVVAISTSMVILNEKLKAFDGIESPKRVVEKITAHSAEAGILSNFTDTAYVPSGNEIQVDDNNHNDRFSISKKNYPITASGCNSTFNSTMDESSTGDKPVTGTSQSSEKAEVDCLQKYHCVDDTSKRNSDPLDMHNFSAEQIVITGGIKDKSKSQLKHPAVPKNSDGPMYVTIDMLKEAMSEMTKTLLPHLNQNKPSTSKATSVSETSVVPEKKCRSETMKELGNPGSGVFITDQQYSQAESTSSPTAMATSLLVSVFSAAVLRESNCKGGVPKNAKNLTIRHKALDSNKLNVMRETVKRRFKSAFKESDFTKAINVKCNKLRAMKCDEKPSDNETPTESDDNPENI